jgi:hypothetical protein
MDDPRLHDLVRALGEWLRPELERSAEARRAVALLGEWLVELASAAEPSSVVDDSSATQTVSAPTVVAVEGDRVEAKRREVAGEGLEAAGAEIVHPGPAAPGDDADRGAWRRLPWTIGQLAGGARDAAKAADPRLGSGIAATERPVDLGLIERRCRIKARACLVAIERRALEGHPVEAAPVVDELDALLAQARALSRCFLWMFYRERVQPQDHALASIAASYEALAAAAALVKRLDEVEESLRSADIQVAMSQLAEASSGLRVALASSWLTSPDTDQEEAHQWLRQETLRRDVFMARYMRLEDAADPARAPTLLAEIEAARGRLEQRHERQARTREALQRLRYHARRIEAGGMPSDHDVRRVFETLTTVVAMGVPASDRRLADALSASTAGRLVGLAPASVQDVLARLASREGEAQDAGREAVPAPERTWSDQVRRVRQWLAGRRVVIIGGEPRPEAGARIEEAFALESADWVRLTEHGSSAPMRPAITHAATAAVLVLVKLTGHQHMDDAMAYARAAGRPFVLLRAGYNPEQIAEAITQQASYQLERSPSPARDPSLP